MNWSDDNLDFFSDQSEAFRKRDEDLEFDYALALSLQEHAAKAKEKSDAFLNKMDDDSDYALALSLQEDLSMEAKAISDVFLNKIDEDSDYALALSLQEDISEEAKRKSSSPSLPKSTPTPLSIVDKQWEVIDPTPNIHALFLQFNVQFFYGKLDGIEVKWSPRMTLCAGVCSYEGRGGLCSVRLSLPLLKLRPRRDLVETLLHEMIHAYLFVTANNKDHDAHGPEFRKHMSRINKETGATISVYHSFHDEVDLYRKHIWKCDGPCQKRRPYFGYVRRAINRAPGPRDPWWADHMSSCGGTFTKVSEPEGYQKSKKTNQKEPVKRKPLKDADNQLSNIKKFLKTPSSSAVSKNVSSLAEIHSKTEKGKEDISLTKNKKPVHTLQNNPVSAFTGHGFLLGHSSNAIPKTFLANVRQEIASCSSAEPKTFLGNVRHEISSANTKTFLASVRQEIASSAIPKTFLADVHQKVGSSASKNSIQTSNKSIQKESCVLGVQTSTRNLGNEDKPVNNNNGSQKIIPNMSKKSNYVQSSIDKFVTLPSRPINNTRSTTEDSNSNMPPKVKCPVCYELLSSSDVNSHLDTCLLSPS